MSYELVDIFSRYFDIAIANEKQLESAYRLRYAVFCEEFGFEDTSKFTVPLEKDAFDKEAIHACLLHHPTQTTVGCIRMLLPTDRPPNLPFEQFIESGFAPTQQRYAEISRLTIDKEYRRRKWDGLIPSGVSSEISQIGRVGRNFPLPAISMIFCGAALSRVYLLDYSFAMMEPRLAYAMSHYGLSFEQVSPIVDYHGQRAAYRINPLSIWETVNPELKPLLNFIYFKISQYSFTPYFHDHKKSA